MPVRRILSLVEQATLERLGCGFALFWGAWVVFFDSFARSPALYGALRLQRYLPARPEWFFACLLWGGAILQIAGMVQSSREMRCWGAMGPAIAFLIVTVSCIVSEPWGTATPTFAGASLMYFVMALRIGTRRAIPAVIYHVS